jgi:hypothetical protein
MSTDALTEAPAIAARVQGWDLSAISHRQLDPGPSWDYESEATALIAGASCVLDCGTGGGEVFGRVAGAAAARRIAIEQWAPNASLASARLSPLGIAVAQADSLRLPFRGEAFDLVVSRHEEIDPTEVDRVLQSGGTFVTQQVSSWQWPELDPFFPTKARFPNHDSQYLAAFESLGYKTTFQSVRFRSAFATVADLAAMLIVAPWEVPGFDVARDSDALLAAERELGTPEGIVVSEGRYVLRAMKR